MLSAINQLVLGDRRTPLGYSSCGTASGLQFVLMDKQQQQGQGLGEER